MTKRHKIQHVKRRLDEGELNANNLHKEVQSFNEKLAVFIVRFVGTMYCAYLFTALALISFQSAVESHNLNVLINWISSNFLQLILLPIIMVGQNVLSRQQEIQSEVDHHINVKLLKIQEEQLQILNLLKDKANANT